MSTAKKSNLVDTEVSSTGVWYVSSVDIINSDAMKRQLAALEKIAKLHPVAATALTTGKTDNKE